MVVCLKFKIDFEIIYVYFYEISKLINSMDMVRYSIKLWIKIVRIKKKLKVDVF